MDVSLQKFLGDHMGIGVGITTDPVDSAPYLKGVANYTRNIVLALHDLKYPIVLFHYKRHNDHIYNLGYPEIILKASGTLSKFLVNANNNIQFDLLHITFPDTFYLPLFTKNINKVLTIHDLLNVYFPPHYKHLRARITNPKAWLQQLIITRAFPKIIEKTDALITTSNFLSNELKKYFNIPEDKLFTVYEGVDHSTFKPLNLPEPDPPFILSESPFPELIKAYYKLVNKYNIRHNLLIFSRRGYGREAMQLVNKLGLHNKVKFLGYVPTDQLVRLYNQASVFIRLDEYDGFNLPTLEAMACGCPVIVHNIDAAPEFFSDCAILVKPFDIDELTSAIYKVLTDTNLMSDMISSGIKKSKEFSWHNTAQELIKVYDEVMYS